MNDNKAQEGYMLGVIDCLATLAERGNLFSAKALQKAFNLSLEELTQHCSFEGGDHLIDLLKKIDCFPNQVFIETENESGWFKVKKHEEKCYRCCFAYKKSAHEDLPTGCRLGGFVCEEISEKNSLHEDSYFVKDEEKE